VKVTTAQTPLKPQTLCDIRVLRLHRQNNNYVLRFLFLYLVHSPTDLLVPTRKNTHLPDEMSKCVSPVEDVPVCVHPGVCCPDLVPLKLLLWEAVRQVVMVEVSNA